MLEYYIPHESSYNLAKDEIPKLGLTFGADIQITFLSLLWSHVVVRSDLIRRPDALASHICCSFNEQQIHSVNERFGVFLIYIFCMSVLPSVLSCLRLRVRTEAQKEQPEVSPLIKHLYPQGKACPVSATRANSGLAEGGPFEVSVLKAGSNGVHCLETSPPPPPTSHPTAWG